MLSTNQAICSIGLLLLLYVAELMQITRKPTTRLGLAIPWGRARQVAVHPVRLERLRTADGAETYRQSARKTALGKRLRVIRAAVTSPVAERGAPVSVLQPGPAARALLLMYGNKWFVGRRFLFETRVTDDGGGAEVRAFLVVTIMPVVLGGLFLAMLLFRGHVLDPISICFSCGGAASILRGLMKTKDLTWAHKEIAARLSLSPSAVAAEVRSRSRSRKAGRATQLA